jgi:hypothetical protein
MSTEDSFDHENAFKKALLKNIYPVRIAIPLNIIYILLCLIGIAMQVVLMVIRAPFYFWASGLWAGLIGIVFCFITLKASKPLFVLN